MIFSPDLAAKVLDGTKTQTRRPVKRAICRYQAGKTYAVQPGRGQKAVGRIRVISVTGPWLVNSIGEADARAEGFDSPAAFLDRWMELYRSVAGRCWRIHFEVVR